MGLERQYFCDNINPSSEFLCKSECENLIRRLRNLRYLPSDDETGRQLWHNEFHFPEQDAGGSPRLSQFFLFPGRSATEPWSSLHESASNAHGVVQEGIPPRHPEGPIPPPLHVSQGVSGSV